MKKLQLKHLKGTDIYFIKFNVLLEHWEQLRYKIEGMNVSLIVYDNSSLFVEVHRGNKIKYYYSTIEVLDYLKDYYKFHSSPSFKKYIDKITEDYEYSQWKEKIANKSITLQQFFESKDELFINCDSVEKIEKLFHFFDKLDKCWDDGEPYRETLSSIFDRNTCFCNKGYKYRCENVSIDKCYDFDHVVFND